jgi:hypothetical protein
MFEASQLEDFDGRRQPADCAFAEWRGLDKLLCFIECMGRE